MAVGDGLDALGERVVEGDAPAGRGATALPAGEIAHLVDGPLDVGRAALDDGLGVGVVLGDGGVPPDRGDGVEDLVAQQAIEDHEAIGLAFEVAALAAVAAGVQAGQRAADAAADEEVREVRPRPRRREVGHPVGVRAQEGDDDEDEHRGGADDTPDSGRPDEVGVDVGDGQRDAERREGEAEREREEAREEEPGGFLVERERHGKAGKSEPDPGDDEPPVVHVPTHRTG
jgi:hypothetical protein